MTKVGFGRSKGNFVANISYDTNLSYDPAGEAIKYPYDGQVGVERYFMGEWEIPNPLKQFGVPRTGFVISYIPNTDRPIFSFETELKDSRGNLIPHYKQEFAELFIFPKEDLKYGETYTVTVKYEDVVDTWSFTTEEGRESIDHSLGLQYTDYVRNAYWSESMLWALQNDLIKGVDKPVPPMGVMKYLLLDDLLTEVQFLTVLFRYGNPTELENVTSSSTWWGAPAYVLAEKYNLPVKGSIHNQDEANKPLSRGDMAVILTSYHTGKVMSEREAVQFMYDAGITKGYTDANGNAPMTYESYGARDTLTRAQMVTFIQRYDAYLRNN